MDGKKSILIVAFLGRISVKSREKVGRKAGKGGSWVEASWQKLRRPGAPVPLNTTRNIYNRDPPPSIQKKTIRARRILSKNTQLRNIGVLC
jgi:hypothetical protein